MVDGKGRHELSDIQIDALREAGNIGAGNAAIALNKMTGNKVVVSVSRINLTPIQEIPGLLGGPETPVVGVRLTVEEGFEGSILLVMERESAFSLVDLLIPEDLEGGGEMVVRKSALQELGSILAGAYLSALSRLTGLAIRPSIAGFALDMAGAVMDAVLAGLDPSTDEALVIETDFKMSGELIEGHLILFPQVGSLYSLFEKLGVPLV